MHCVMTSLNVFIALIVLIYFKLHKIFATIIVFILTALLRRHKRRQTITPICREVVRHTSTCYRHRSWAPVHLD